MPDASERPEQLVLLRPITHAQADEDVRLGRIAVAVVELGDVAPPEQAAELLEAARPLRDRGREDRLAGLAEIGPFRDEAEPVEVHVRPAQHGHEALPAATGLLDVALGAGDPERRRRLDDRPRVLEHVLHRGAQLVGVDEDHLVDIATGEPEGLDADLLHGDPVGEQADVGEDDASAGPQRALHRVGVRRLDADDADLGTEPFHVGGDAPDQPAAADRDEDGVDRLPQLAQDLHRDRPLARDHVDVVVGVHERQSPAANDSHRLGIGVVVGVALEHDGRSEGRDRVDLDLRRRHRHHDRRLGAESLAPRAPRPARGCRRRPRRPRA